ncbi:MAG TPA: N-6 DNA methylase, partial [Candidatus Latescibacteria bacterium]|nr:N-6 DNA methylase [Candidatus Latescibacterota bacterium]
MSSEPDSKILIKPTQQAIRQYYAELANLAEHGATNETTIRVAFQHLLEKTCRERKWTLLTEHHMKVNGREIILDGALVDEYTQQRGAWEAKDAKDDLDREIAGKRADGYPLKNTIFENSLRAVLYQDGKEVMSTDITKPENLANLLTQFYRYSEPHIEEFHRAMEEFKQRVPELARGLLEIIRKAHTDNPAFIAAFDDFFRLCQTSLNPNMSEATVDEMLVQHLLTERIMSEVFSYSDFRQKNAVAAEVEKVIAALASKSFSRADFLKSLDRFYVAIENAARSVSDFTEKQHFINTVYERFFQGYSVKIADTHGIVYTPQPIVDFMCASVEQVLKDEFGLSLGSPGVQILDPCTGTGSFIVNLLGRIPPTDLKRVYREQLFANEIMLLPYYIASLNIEHRYWELTGSYEPFEGLCFVDTLELAEPKQRSLFVEKNTERVEREKEAPITVIIGNPPYNVGQENENDNNKNRPYPEIDKRIRNTYAKDSRATLKNQLYDAYVKFFRWATDRLDGRDGVVCFVSNNSFVDQIAFDGMRKHLLKDFTDIWHLETV